MGVEWKSRDAVIEEPGRRIVQEQTRTGGQALPWLDMTAFLRGAIDLALDNHANAPRSNTQWVFFDRGLIDAAAAPQALDGTTILDTIAQSHRYHSRIFLAPPWPEIYVQDEERRHSMDEARAGRGRGALENLRAETSGILAVCDNRTAKRKRIVDTGLGRG